MSDAGKTRAGESTPREDAPYFEAVGRFVAEYASAEAGAHMFVRHLSGISDDKARYIFSGMRLDEVAERIRQLMRMDAGEDDRYKDADGCLSQLRKIADRRQRLVHRHVSFNSAALHVTNALTAKVFAAPEKDVFTLPDLEAMRQDCVVIFMRFVYLRDPRIKESLLLDDELRLHVYGPWRYSPPAARPRG